MGRKPVVQDSLIRSLRKRRITTRETFSSVKEEPEVRERKLTTLNSMRLENQRTLAPKRVSKIFPPRKSL